MKHNVLFLAVLAGISVSLCAMKEKKPSHDSLPALIDSSKETVEQGMALVKQMFMNAFEKTPPLVADKTSYLNARIELMQARILSNPDRYCVLVKDTKEAPLGFFAGHQCDKSPERVIIYTMSLGQGLSLEVKKKTMSLLFTHALRKFPHAKQFWVALAKYNATTANELKYLGYTESDDAYDYEKGTYQGYEVSVADLKARLLGTAK